MAQEQDADARGPQANRYSPLGDEVASVLSSAREAAGEMREQATRYADALLAGARQEIDDLTAGARSEAEAIVNTAKDEAEGILRQTRRQVLTILEAAQTRLHDTERATEAAVRRHDEMLQTESDLEGRLTDLLASVQANVSGLQARRDEEAVPTVGDAPSPAEALAELLSQTEADLAGEAQPEA